MLLALEDRRPASIQRKMQHFPPKTKDDIDQFIVKGCFGEGFNYHMFGGVRCQMEFVQWHKEAPEQSHQKAQIHSVFEVRVQV